MSQIFASKPIVKRKNIPFYCLKSESQVKNDKYEYFFEAVQKNAFIHLADTFWSKYAHQSVLDWVEKELIGREFKVILDAGCGTGRMAAHLANQFRNAQVLGLDYSYQMLKFANEFWNLKKQFELWIPSSGFPKINIQPPTQFNHVEFLLSKAEKTPFANNSIDLIISSFLFDRLKEPSLFLEESFRILKDGGSFILISPLNFSSESHWKDFHPSDKLLAQISKNNFKIEHYNFDLMVEEPLDLNGNCIKYNVSAIHAIKENIFSSTKIHP